MADMRQPPRPQTRPGSGPARRPVPQKKPTPWYVWAGLVVASIAVVLLVWNLVAPKQEVAQSTQAEKKVDRTSKLKSLEKQIPTLRAEFKVADEETRGEKAGAKQKGEALKKKLEKWLEEWDEALQPLLGPDEKLPPEYAGYNAARRDVAKIRYDLMKISGF